MIESACQFLFLKTCQDFDYDGTESINQHRNHDILTMLRLPIYEYEAPLYLSFLSFLIFIYLLSPGLVAGGLLCCSLPAP